MQEEKYITQQVTNQLVVEIQPLLTQREWFVVQRYFDIGKEHQTLAQIGKQMDVTGSRIGQIKKTAVQKLNATWHPDLSSRQDTLNNLRAIASYYPPGLPSRVPTKHH